MPLRTLMVCLLCVHPPTETPEIPILSPPCLQSFSNQLYGLSRQTSVTSMGSALPVNHYCLGGTCACKKLRHHFMAPRVDLPSWWSMPTSAAEVQ